MIVETVQNYTSTTIDAFAAQITKYIDSGDITVITRVEAYDGTGALGPSANNDSLKFYNGNKLILDLKNLAGGNTYSVTIYGSASDAYTNSTTSIVGSSRYIYRMIVCKHGLMFKTASSGTSTVQKGCIFFTETKSGETGVFVRAASGSSLIWTGYYIAWGDQPVFAAIALESATHQSFTSLSAIPTQSPDGNHSVNTYHMPFSQFKTYDGLIEINDEKYYTDGSIAIKDE